MGKNRRQEIELSPQELDELYASHRAVSVASNGPDGWPHVMALWYVSIDRKLWIWTYGKSQKVKNLERDPKATLMIEDGTAYNELRGAMMRCSATVHSDPQCVLEIGERILRKYALDDEQGELDEATLTSLKRRSAKRVAVEFEVVETISWDHRKLG